MDLYQHSDFGRLYPGSSYGIQYSPQYANFKNWEGRNWNIQANHSEKAKEIVSNFDECLSIREERDYGNSKLEVNEFPIDSDNHTAKFECNDEEWINQYEWDEESSSIHSSQAIEASSEFVKNDYISLKYEDERTFSQNYQYNIFYDKNNLHYRTESPQIYPQFQYQSSQNMYYQPSGIQPKKKEVIIENTQANPKSFCAKPVFSSAEIVNWNKRQKIGEDLSDVTLVKKTKNVVVLKKLNDTEEKMPENLVSNSQMSDFELKNKHCNEEIISQQSRQVIDCIVNQKENIGSEVSNIENNRVLEISGNCHSEEASGKINNEEDDKKVSEEDNLFANEVLDQEDLSSPQPVQEEEEEEEDKDEYEISEAEDDDSEDSDYEEWKKTSSKGSNKDKSMESINIKEEIKKNNKSKPTIKESNAK